jgi:hypothetical protein
MERRNRLQASGLRLQEKMAGKSRKAGGREV